MADLWALPAGFFDGLRIEENVVVLRRPRGFSAPPVARGVTGVAAPGVAAGQGTAPVRGYGLSRGWGVWSS